MSSNTMGFLALRNRYVIEGYLKFDGGVHVGSGYEAGDSDAGFVRGAFARNKAFVPGSSLRGVMRSTIERIMKAAKPESTCVLFLRGVESHESCFTANPDELRKWKADWEKRKVPIAQQEADFLELLGAGGQCDVCKLFGSPNMASKLKIDDCRLKEGGERAIRHGVGIDRDTETAAAKIKYDFETLDGAPRFQLRMQLENADQSDLALMGVLLHEMEHQGIYIGGKKSRGLGRCKLEKSYKVCYFDETNLTTYLLSGKLAEMKDFEKTVLSPGITAYFTGGANAAAIA